jgi:hypothetical protein
MISDLSLVLTSAAFGLCVGLCWDFGHVRLSRICQRQAARIRELQQQVDAANAHVGELVRQDRALHAAFLRGGTVDSWAEQDIGRAPVDPWLVGEGRG